ncbi:MAG: hypothetical protein IJ301_01240 [Clostridia bacterium]|nr:hypothetical protein [Clostridia bacterium]
MRRLIWGKTLFESYKYIGRVVGSIDRLVLESSANSYTTCSNTNETLDKMEAVIDLIERKKRLLTIKMIIEEGVKNMDYDSAKLLIRYYVDKMDSNSIAEEFEMNRRTINRRINNAVCDCMQKIYNLGYNLKFFETLLENEGWIVGLYNSYVARYLHKDKTLVPLSIPKLKKIDRLINSVYGRV